MAVSSEKLESQLLSYKKLLGDALANSADILRGRSVSDIMLVDNADPLEASFLYALKYYVNGTDARLYQKQEMQEAFNKLPDSIKDVIEAKQLLFGNVPAYTEEHKQQQLATLNMARKAMGLEEVNLSDGELVIKLKATSELREYLEEVKKIDAVSVEFEPRVFDEKALKALNKLVAYQAQQAGISMSSANDMMIVHIKGMGSENFVGGVSGINRNQMDVLSNTVAMRNLLNLIVTGETPNGTAGVKPQTMVNWDEPWTLHDSGDIFFSKRVYDTLFQEKYGDGTHLTIGVLFNENDYRPESYEILKKAAAEVGIVPSQTNAHCMISEMDVGKIAIEIMKIRAEQVWCKEHSGEKFDQKQVHAMIHNEEFMPHQNDLRLVDVGFGVPDISVKLENGDIANLKAMEEEMGVQSWHLEYSGFEHVISQHRVEKFRETFGDMPQNAIKKKAEVIAGCCTDYDKKETCVYEVAGTPAMYFHPNIFALGGGLDRKYYEEARSKYLKETQDVFENGCGVSNSVCAGKKGAADKFKEAANKDNNTVNDISAQIEDNKHGVGCTIQDELERRGKNPFLPVYEGNHTTTLPEGVTPKLNN